MNAVQKHEIERGISKYIKSNNPAKPWQALRVGYVTYSYFTNHNWGNMNPGMWQELANALERINSK